MGFEARAGAPVMIAPRVQLWPTPDVPRDLTPDLIALGSVPSAAFGDGSHPTTRLCARAVDAACRGRVPAAVLDVGTGTGVLARLARAHGAAFVVGTDVLESALAAARVNAALDRCPGEILFTAAPPDAWGARFDLVVANILEGVLVTLAGALVAALAPGGALLVSGFTAAQTPALRAAFTARGVRVALQAEREGWCLLQLAKAG